MPNYLGQHYLKNSAVIKKIIAAINPQSGETIIEVGPGHGELTVPLAGACEKIGAKIISVEKDKKLAEALRLKMESLKTGELKLGRVDILNGDALSILPSQVINLQSFKIVGNIPYYITGHLLRAVSELDAKPTRAVFTIQKEVAERICASPPRMNRLAASVQFWAKPKIIAHVPPVDFSPPPKVDSAVIQLDARALNADSAENHSEGGDIKSPDNAEHYYAAVRVLFAQPRKTILNNLAAGLTSPPTTKSEIITMLSQLGIDPKARPQDLTIENIAKIAACPSVHK